MKGQERQRLLIKVGGSILEDPGACTRFAKSVLRARRVGGWDIVIVHGGGAQLSRQQERLGIDVERDPRGLRITHEDTALAAIQVLGGEVNAALVAALSSVGVRAVGLTGADADLLQATPVDPALGWVGEIASVSTDVLDRLVGAGFVPVVATMAPAVGGAVGDPFLNVNADAAAGPIASAWKASAALFLSDIDAVRGPDGPLKSLHRRRAKSLEAQGVLAGGMIPKVEAALYVAESLPGALVKIASGLVEDPIESALTTSKGTLVSALGRERGARIESEAVSPAAPAKGASHGS